MYIDFGYALSPLEKGVTSHQLEFVEYTDLRKQAFPQISVVVDSLGDVYAYREAGFLDRPGAHRYIVGNLLEQRTMEGVLRQFLNRDAGFDSLPGDALYLDIFDHVVTKLLNQAEADQKWGIPFGEGPVLGHTLHGGDGHSAPALAHFSRA